MKITACLLEACILGHWKIIRVFVLIIRVFVLYNVNTIYRIILLLKINVITVTIKSVAGKDLKVTNMMGRNIESVLVGGCFY